MRKTSKFPIIYAGIALAGALCWGGVNYANQTTNKLENKIESVLLAEKLGHAHVYGPNDAERTLVHIKQKHRVDGLSDIGEAISKMFEEYERVRISSNNPAELTQTSNKLAQISNVYSNTLESISNSQNSIYRFLDSLQRENPGITVYSEGLAIEDYEFHQSNISKLQQARAKLEQLRIENPNHPKFKEYVMKYEKTKGDIVNNAGTKLFFEGKVIERPAEIKADCVENITALNEKDKKRAENAMEKRENNLLEILSREDQKVGLIIFGASHSWTNNIDSWNAQHGKERFRLMEVDLN